MGRLECEVRLTTFAAARLNKNEQARPALLRQHNAPVLAVLCTCREAPRFSARAGAVRVRRGAVAAAGAGGISAAGPLPQGPQLAAHLQLLACDRELTWLHPPRPCSTCRPWCWRAAATTCPACSRPPRWRSRTRAWSCWTCCRAWRWWGGLARAGGGLAGAGRAHLWVATRCRPGRRRGDWAFAAPSLATPPGTARQHAAAGPGARGGGGRGRQRAAGPAAAAGRGGRRGGRRGAGRGGPARVEPA
jgi:hypothetical protein